MRLLPILFTILFAQPLWAEPERIIRSVSEAKRLKPSDYSKNLPFEIRGRIVFKDLFFYILEDAGERITLSANHAEHYLLENTNSCKNSLAERGGDLVVVRGHTEHHDGLYYRLRADKITIVGFDHPDSPKAVSGEIITSGKADCHLVSVTGVVVSTYHDEIDPKYTFLILNCEGTFVTAIVRNGDNNDNSWIRETVFSTVQICGISLWGAGRRKYLGNYIYALTHKDIRIISPAADPFTSPDLEEDPHFSTADILKLGPRKISGVVLAMKEPRSFLLKSDDGRFLRVTLAHGEHPPAVGNHICAAGRATTDLYRLNLTEAQTRQLAPIRDSPETPMTVSDFFWTLARQGNAAALFGKCCRVNGVVRDVQSSSESVSRLELECRNRRIVIEATGAPGEKLGKIAQDSNIEITGVFMTDQDDALPNLPPPQIRGWSLVPRTPEDIRILARPPWWTPARLAGLVAVLFVALIGFFLWNRWLNRLVNRRSRELFKEQIASANAELRIDERTRLAAELHDSLSQNLSGIACQLNAAKLTLEGNPETRDLLQTTERMLQSCRTELTRCIWDLRGDTLEEPDFTTAIRKTLAALALPVELLVRFNVPRTKVSDSTAHAILCIVRELVTNAVRHGHATRVRVAGSVERNSLLFSVRDDGCGFDMANRPGVGEGHFGLAGIGDRISRLGGTFDLESHPGAGTSARIAIPLVHGSDSGKSAL